MCHISKVICVDKTLGSWEHCEGMGGIAIFCMSAQAAHCPLLTARAPLSLPTPSFHCPCPLPTVPAPYCPLFRSR